MKKIVYFILLFFVTKSTTFASLSWFLCIDSSTMRNWYLTWKHIPTAISCATNYFMTIAWTISVIFIIIWAYQILFSSTSWSNQKWKETIIWAIIWFVIAAMAYVIVKFIIDNLS